MSSSVDFMLEETDDDFILVSFEKEDSFASETVPDDEPTLDLNCIIAAEPTFESPKHAAISRKCLRKMHRHRLFERETIEDVVKAHVLAFLPAKSLYKCRAVSKAWEGWISNPFFIHQQTLHFKDVSGLFCQLPGEDPTFMSLDDSSFGVPNPTLNFLPECVDIRATTNGLLCCQGQSGNQPYYICNPVTEQWKMLPNPSLYHVPGTGVALAFEPSTYNFSSHYELIAAVPMLDSPILFFEIYSSKTDSWRISETVYCESNAKGAIGDGIYMKGYAHWEMQSGFVLAFNVDHEQCEVISLPNDSLPTSALTAKDGELCYLNAQEVCSGNYRVEVYGTMDMELMDVIPVRHEVDCHLGANGVCRAVCFVNGDMLIIEAEGQIIAYNDKEEESRWLGMANTKGFSKYLPYVNSLVTVAGPEATEID